MSVLGMHLATFFTAAPPARTCTRAMAACAAASLMRPFFTRLARLDWMRPRPP